MEQLLSNTAPIVLPEMPELLLKLNPGANYTDTIVLPEGLTYEKCFAVVHEIFKRHDILRLKIEIRNDGKVFSLLPPDAPFNLLRIDLSRELRAGGPAAAWRKVDEIKQEFESSLDAYSLFAYLELGGAAPNRLHIILDHINYDGYALMVLTDDINSGIEQAMSGQKIEFGPPSASYHDWVLRTQQFLESDEAQRHLQYWTDRPWNDVHKLRGRERGYDLPAFARLTSMTLNTTASERIHVWARKARIPIWEVLLACVAATAREVFHSGSSPITITTMVNQRTITFDDLDLSSTLGFLRAAIDYVLEADEKTELVDVIKSVHQQIEDAPLGGTTYELLKMRYKNRIKTTKSGIAFNYYGSTNEPTGAPDEDDMVHDEVISRCSTERTFADDDLSWMMRWPEYRFDMLTPDGVYLLRLHFIEPLAEEAGSRYYDIWINQTIAVEKLDIFERAGGKHKLLIEEVLCKADDAGCVRINFVSYCNSLANASINALEIMEPKPGHAVTTPIDLSNFRAVLRVNAGGPAIGDFAADTFATEQCASDTDTTPIDFGAQRDPAPLAVYQTDSYCTTPNIIRHWPAITLKCVRNSSGLKFWMETYDSAHDSGVIHEIFRCLCANVKAIASW